MLCGKRLPQIARHEGPLGPARLNRTPGSLWIAPTLPGKVPHGTRETDSRHRRSRILGVSLVRTAGRAGQSRVLPRQFSDRQSGQYRDLLDHTRFTFLKHDIVEPFDLRVDEIYNLACPASPIHYQSDPIHTLKTSVYGSIHLLNLAVRYQARILQASTSEVYGDPHQHPQTETYWGNVNPTASAPATTRASGVPKPCSSTITAMMVPIKVARIFNTYGPRMDRHDGRVVSNFIVQALQEHPITIYGDGRQTRSFCFVKDLVDGLVSLMGTRRELTGPVEPGQSARGDHAALGPADPGADGLAVSGELRTPSAGRPVRPPSGHRPGPHAVELASAYESQRRSARHSHLSSAATRRRTNRRHALPTAEARDHSSSWTRRPHSSRVPGLRRGIAFDGRTRARSQLPRPA